MDRITALLPARLRPYAKSVTGLLGTVLAVVSIVYADAEWLPVVVQVATVLGVYAVPNVDDVEDDYVGEHAA